MFCKVGKWALRFGAAIVLASGCFLGLAILEPLLAAWKIEDECICGLALMGSVLIGFGLTRLLRLGKRLKVG